MNYEALLETYSLSDLLEMNDLTEAEVTKFLVDAKVLELPEITPLEFEE